MKLADILVEASAKMGLIFSYVDGQFEDIELVDWNTQMVVRGNHSANLFKSLIRVIREHGDFSEFAKFARQHLQGGKKLGPDYADQGENDLYVMYPVDDQVIGDLIDMYEDETGANDRDEDEYPHEDEYSRRGLRRSDFY